MIACADGVHVKLWAHNESENCENEVWYTDLWEINNNDTDILKIKLS